MEDDVLTHTVAVVSAYVSCNALPAAELPGLIASVHRVLLVCGVRGHVEFVSSDWLREIVADAKTGPQGAWQVRLEPAVPVAESVHRDHIVCLEDGRKFRSLRRHLAVLGMTPEQYRARWNLAPDYPMTCAAYSEKRSALAIANGLGRKKTA